MKRIKKIIFILITIIALLSPMSFVLISAFSLTPVYTNAFSNVLYNKYTRLRQNKNEKKIIIIGGSSVPFSLRSSLVEKELPQYKCIDFGLYAAIGNKVMIDLSKESINEGDIVIISNEISSQSMSLYFSGLEYLKAVDGHFNMINKLKYNDKKKVIADLSSFAMQKLNLSKQNLINPEGIYNRNSFDTTYFDINSSLCESNILPLDYDPTMEINLTEDISKEFFSYLNNFSNYCKKRKANIYFRFSPMNIKAISRESNIDKYYQYINSNINFDIMGNIYNSIIESGYFYDSNYHLNNAGAINFTKKLIQDIKLTLKDDSKTNIENREIPKKDTELKDDLNNSDSAYFIYKEENNNYIITGLTDEGKGKESLIIPASYKGKNVIYFNQDVFQNNPNIKNITIQNNITTLFDHSFINSKLETIEIKNTKPNTLKVGLHLLDNNKIKVYVPDSSYNEYLLDYSWSNYTNYIYKLSAK